MANETQRLNLMGPLRKKGLAKIHCLRVTISRPSVPKNDPLKLSVGQNLVCIDKIFDPSLSVTVLNRNTTLF